jgi:enoyl-CoA hydratase
VEAERLADLTEQLKSNLYIQTEPATSHCGGYGGCAEDEVGLTYTNILYDVADRVALITLNRPQSRNALSTPLVEEFIQALDKADKDASVSVVVVAGAGGKAFSAGYDMKESAGNRDHSFTASRARTHWDLRFILSVWECSKPVIAMIDGYCLAGGFEFAMGCDARYCTDQSTFASLEARFASAVTPIMPWVIGQRCRSLI